MDVALEDISLQSYIRWLVEISRPLGKCVLIINCIDLMVIIRWLVFR